MIKPLIQTLTTIPFVHRVTTLSLNSILANVPIMTYFRILNGKLGHDWESEPSSDKGMSGVAVHVACVAAHIQLSLHAPHVVAPKE